MRAYATEKTEAQQGFGGFALSGEEEMKRKIEKQNESGRGVVRQEKNEDD